MYGYTSKRTTPNNFDGPHDCRGEDMITPVSGIPEQHNGPRLPEKVYCWAPKVCHQPEAPLMRHASPV